MMPLHETHKLAGFQVQVSDPKTSRMRGVSPLHDTRAAAEAYMELYLKAYPTARPVIVQVIKKKLRRCCKVG